jgi:hypothetical protein
VVFALVCSTAALATQRSAPAIPPVRPESVVAPPAPRANKKERARNAPPVVERPQVKAPTRWEYALWLVLPMLASVMLMSATTYVTEDVAPFPLLWVAPLAFYLLSFILTFESDRWYRRWVFVPLFGLATGQCIVAWYIAASGFPALLLPFQLPETLNRVLSYVVSYQSTVIGQLQSHMLLVFAGSMLCHGELAQRRPAPQYLTAFYMSISAGGVLGGLFVAIIAPFVFNDSYDLQLAVWGVWTMMVILYCTRPAARKMGYGGLALCVVFAVLDIFLGAVLEGYLEGQRRDILETSRNFYGVLKVVERNKDNPELHHKSLKHGRIVHGHQYQSEELKHQPISYYDRGSGVALAMELKSERPSKKIGVIGLGVGVLTAYGKSGDSVRIYEINSDVIRLAKKWFTYLDTSQALTEIVEGDARLSLEREAPQQFDVLALDAFSGDSIPVHLLTREACQTYLRHMAPGGIMAFHISNRYIDLVPVVQGLAEELELGGRVVSADGDSSRGGAASTWILLSTDRELLDKQDVGGSLMDWGPTVCPPVLWTDDYSNVLKVVRPTEMNLGWLQPAN